MSLLARNGIVLRNTILLPQRTPIPAGLCRPLPREQFLWRGKRIVLRK
jgi:hypothetical protein